jgi:hypothetical protein
MIKTIYICWLQGFDNAPDAVQHCVQSWKYYNPDWKIVLLDSTNLKSYVNLEDYIPDIDNKEIDNTALSDIIRVLLLKKYGGVWADSTTFCNKPLSEWLLPYIKEDFFAFKNPTPDIVLSSWFLYANKNTYIINKWVDTVLYYYTIHNKPHTYFWVHNLFGKLYKSDSTFKKKWNNVPIILSQSEKGPHYIQKQGMFKMISNENKIDIISQLTPVYKLTYKTNFHLYSKKKLVYYLFSTIPSNQSITKKMKYYNRKSKKKVYENCNLRLEK